MCQTTTSSPATRTTVPAASAASGSIALAAAALATHPFLAKATSEEPLAGLAARGRSGAIADGMPGIALVGDPVRLRSGWLNGIKTLPVNYR